MEDAIEHGDPNEKLIKIDEWLLHYRGKTPGCPACGNAIGVKGENSPNVVTHFAHGPNTFCPLTEKFSKAYEGFEKVDRVDAGAARKIKQYALDHLESIYQRATDLCPGLLWKEFLPLLEKASELNIWSFKGFNPGYLPYVLLCCEPSFPGKPKTTRPHTLFFVLEPGSRSTQFWQQPAGPKQRIWRVDTTAQTHDVILMKLEEVEPWYRTKAKLALKL